MLDLQTILNETDEQMLADLSLSDQAKGMKASEILVIAYAVKAAIARGEDIANFTVGDFSPAEFQIPDALKAYTIDALRANATNYPPAHGTPELREALQGHYADRLDLKFPLDAFVVASGARPVLYAAYQTLLNQGEVVVTPAPSWNNTNFCQLVGAEHVVVRTSPELGFMPTARDLEPHLGTARLLVLCSPMNPAGTLIEENQLREICELIVAENRRRLAENRRTLFLIYDQVYWMLTLGQRTHVTPQKVCPEIAPFCILTDAVSKSFAGTGLRVGWAAAPPFLASRLKSLMTHMGAWAPKPEQLGTAHFLQNRDAVDEYLVRFRERIRSRLTALYDGFTAMAAEGLPVAAIEPQGAIYLSAYIDYRELPGINNDVELTQFLLEQAGCAVVPFSAFGDSANVGWFRFSVGAVTDEEIAAVLPRIRDAMRTLQSGAGQH